MAGPLQGSELFDSLRSQVREVVERTLADPEYAQKLQAIAMADPASPELFEPPPSLLAALAEIEVLTVLKPFVQQSPPKQMPLAQLPTALREFAGRVSQDKGMEQATRDTIERVNARGRSDHEDLYDLIALFARTPDELSQLLPPESAEELLPSATVATTLTTTTTITTSLTTSSPACTGTTTSTTLTTTTTMSNFCPAVVEKAVV